MSWRSGSYPSGTRERLIVRASYYRRTYLVGLSDSLLMGLMLRPCERRPFNVRDGLESWLRKNGHDRNDRDVILESEPSAGEDTASEGPVMDEITAAMSTSSWSPNNGSAHATTQKRTSSRYLAHQLR